MTEILERSKSHVVDFNDLMFNGCDPLGALQRFAGEDYRQHNPEVAVLRRIADDR